MAPPIVLPDPLVEAVVEVEVFKVLELAARRREQLLAGADMVVHRAADVEEQQHLYRVAPLRDHLDVEIAAVMRGRAERVRQVELARRAVPREAAQAAECADRTRTRPNSRQLYAPSK